MLSSCSFEAEKPLCYSKENQEACMRNLLIYEEELIKETCKPERHIDWCWDDDEKSFFKIT